MFRWSYIFFHFLYCHFCVLYPIFVFLFLYVLSILSYFPLSFFGMASFRFENRAPVAIVHAVTTDSMIVTSPHLFCRGVYPSVWRHVWYSEIFHRSSCWQYSRYSQYLDWAYAWHRLWRHNWAMQTLEWMRCNALVGLFQPGRQSVCLLLWGNRLRATLRRHSWADTGQSALGLAHGTCKVIGSKQIFISFWYHVKSQLVFPCVSESSILWHSSSNIRQINLSISSSLLFCKMHPNLSQEFQANWKVSKW